MGDMMALEKIVLVMNKFKVGEEYDSPVIFCSECDWKENRRTDLGDVIRECAIHWYFNHESV
jgi:hypothetical protein